MTVKHRACFSLIPSVAQKAGNWLGGKTGITNPPRSSNWLIYILYTRSSKSYIACTCSVIIMYAKS